MKGPSAIKKKLIWTALLVAMLGAFILYLVIGFTGAAMFGTHITDNILTAFGMCGEYKLTF